MTAIRRPFCTKEQLETIAKKYPTPFYLYDEKGIRDTALKVKAAFSWNKGFKEYFAVKATPNPIILAIMREYGFGFDCSSEAELMLMEAMGVPGEDIMFSSNDTAAADFAYAHRLYAQINLDDITHIKTLESVIDKLPDFISLRFNPGGAFKFANGIFGSPQDAKFGFTEDQVVEAVRYLQSKGVKHFGLHALLASATLSDDYYPTVAKFLCRLAVRLKQELNADVTLINLSGGVGIPYKPTDPANNIEVIGEKVHQVFDEILEPAGIQDVALATEMGRFMLGPYGALVTRVINLKHTYDDYVGVDACAADLMRPMLYGAYHYITVIGKEDEPKNHTYSVTGGLCENSDRFATHRPLPEVEIGDLLFIHDCGAHGHAMGYNYNGKLRSAEILLREDGSTMLMRRRETPMDYFVTLDCLPIYRRLQAIYDRKLERGEH